MKRTLALFLCTLLTLAACPAMAAAPARDGLISLAGKMSYVSLEGGFFSLGGYRLVCACDLKPYLERDVAVQGYEDTSPSIFMVKTLTVTQIEQTDSPGSNLAGIQGALLYDYESESLTIRGRALQWDDGLAPYFGKYVRACGTLDTQGVLTVSSIEAVDPPSVGAIVSDELYFATRRTANNRLKYALCDMIAVNGAVKKDSLYQKLASQLGKEDGKYCLFVNGIKVYFSPDAQPAMRSSTLFAPVQPLLDALSLTQAQTFAADDNIMLFEGDLGVTFTLGSRTARVGDEEIDLPAAPYLGDSGAMLPVKALCAALGYQIYSRGKVFAAFRE